MRVALETHNETLRSAIESRTQAASSSTPATGCVRSSRHHGPRVDAAIAAQRALELPVRMGIATGEAEMRRR